MRENRRRLVKILTPLGVGVAVFLFLFGSRIWWAIKGVTPGDLITISKETTYLTEPLDEFGFVDYVEAINLQHAKGVTPETNFEVVVRSVLGAESIEPSMQVEYFARLGTAPPQFPDGRFEMLSDFLKSQSAPAGEDEVAWEEKQSVVMERPWTADEFPATAAWIESNGKYLDAIAEGTRRTHDYTPYVSPDGQLISIRYSAQDRRELARGLVTRSLLRIGSNDQDGAWQDILALHRLARHTTSGASGIEGLIGIALESMAASATRELVQQGGLNDGQLSQMANDLRALGPLSPFSEKLDGMERLTYLSSTTSIVRTAVAGQAGGGVAPAITGSNVAAIDWNDMMRRANGNYDALVDAAHDEPHERRARVRALQTQFKERADEARQPARLFVNWIRGTASAEMIETMMFSMLMPSVEQFFNAEDRASVKLSLCRIAIALERHRLEHGSYPDSLDALAPRFIESIPPDRFSGNSFVYTRQDGGFLVYSVGFDGEDDGGRGPGLQPGADIDDVDDIGVEITR